LSWVIRPEVLVAVVVVAVAVAVDGAGH
jgi:hypothetical protein